MHLFERIEIGIEEGRRLRGQKRFHWTLPRQVGATTWILKQVRKDLENGLVVVLAGLTHLRYDIQNDEFLYLAEKNRQLIFMSENMNSNSIRGRNVDRVYADNIDYWSSKNILDFAYSIIPALITRDGYAVFIDTTEG